MTKNHRSALPPIPKKMGSGRQGFGGAGGGKGIGPNKGGIRRQGSKRG